MTKNRIATIAGGIAASLAVLVGAYDVSAASSATSAATSTDTSTGSSASAGGSASGSVTTSRAVVLHSGH